MEELLAKLDMKSIPKMEGGKMPNKVIAGLKAYRLFYAKKRKEGYSPEESKLLWRQHKKSKKAPKKVVKKAPKKRGKGMSGGNAELLKLMSKLMV